MPVSTTSQADVTYPLGYYSFTQADGTPVYWTSVLGTSTNGTPGVNVAGGVMTLQSATSTTGSNAVADRVGVQFNRDPSKHTYWSFSGQYAQVNANSIFDIYLSAGQLDNTFSEGTNYVQFEFNTVQGRIGYKQTAFSSGSFQTLMPYTNFGTNGTAVPNTDGNHWYGFKVDLVNNGDGTATARLFQGTTAQWSTNTLPMLGFATLTATEVTDLQVGYLSIIQLGYTNAGSGVYGATKFQKLTIVGN